MPQVIVNNRVRQFPYNQQGYRDAMAYAIQTGGRFVDDAPQKPTKPNPPTKQRPYKPK